MLHSSFEHLNAALVRISIILKYLNIIMFTNFQQVLYVRHVHTHTNTHRTSLDNCLQRSTQNNDIYMNAINDVVSGFKWKLLISFSAWVENCT